MKAARLHRPQGPILIEEAPRPGPGPGEVRLRIEACGLCHSDLFIRSLDQLPRTPLTLGHEAIGVVDETGPGVEHLRSGDRVGLTYLYAGCGACEACRKGRPELCPRQMNTGYHVDGAFADYALARAEYVTKVPDGLSAEQAAPLCCAGWTAYHAIHSAGLDPGSWIAIFGVGGLGHLGIQFARLQGLRVAAVDLSGEKLAMAEKLGAELAIDAGKGNPAREIKKKTGGAHAAVSFVASASVIQQGVGCLRRNGVLILVGLASQSFELSLVEIVLKQLRLQGSFLGRQEELKEVFEIARRGELQLETQTCSLENLPEAMDQLHAGRLKGRMVVTF